MTRQYFMVFVVFVSLAVFHCGNAEAQWGQSNRGWGGRSNGWGGRSNGWGGRSNSWGGRSNSWGGRSNRSNELGQVLGGIGKIIDGAIQGNNQGPIYDDYQNEIPSGSNSTTIFEDTGKLLGPLLTNPPPPPPPGPIYVPPQGGYNPPVYTRKNETKPKTKVKANDLPVAKPKPKKQASVVPNAFSLDGSYITADDIDKTIADAENDIEHTADDIREDMVDKLKEDADHLQPPPANLDKIKEKLDSHDSVDGMIPIGTGPPGLVNRLNNADSAFDKLDNIVKDAMDGRLRPKDLDKFQADYGDMFDSGTNLANNLDTISTDSFWIDLLDDARPNVTSLPIGMGTQIIYVPNMPCNQIVSLGNGTLLVGTGGATNGVVMMTGNVAQAAGLSVGIGPPVPETEAEEILNGVLLINKGEKEVHYNVNSDQFSMTPDYQQTLPGDDTWTVEFDRGGSNGTAKYGISNGTYAFTPTDSGWELYEQPELKVTIDNTDNKFPFNYVLDNTQQTVAAGQANEHTNKYPMVIRFDDGTGTERRKSLDEEVYTLAVTDEGTIDLFEPSAVAPPIKMEQVAKAPSVSGRALLQLDGKRSGGLFSGNGGSSSRKSQGGLLSFN